MEKPQFLVCDLLRVRYVFYPPTSAYSTTANQIIININLSDFSSLFDSLYVLIKIVDGINNSMVGTTHVMEN